MTEIPLIIQRLREPISDNTRKIRRELLVVSTIGIVIVYAGLVPTKIDALGITLTPSNQASFRYVIAGVVLYLTVAFLIYVSSEIIAWASLFRSLDLEKMQEQLTRDINQATEDIKAAEEKKKAAAEELKDAASGEPIEAAFLRQAERKRLFHKLKEAQQFHKEHKDEIEEKRDLLELLGQPLSMAQFARDLRSPGSRPFVEPVRLLKPMSALRMSFEALIPLALAVFAVLSLLTSA